MLGQSVLVVLTNYKRPANLPEIIGDFREQSVQAKRIVVVDNSPDKGVELYPSERLLGADDVWRWRQNLGCPCHFAPALCMYDCKYVLFCDDDVLPGSKAIEHLLESAAMLEDRFSTLGQVGRKFRSGIQYVYGDVWRSLNGPQVCNVTCRAHLVQMNRLYHLIPFRNKLMERFGDEAARLVGIHDDLLMCLGLQMGTNYPSYVTTSNQDREQQLIASNLDQAGAVYKRPEHLAERNRFVAMAIECGWKEPKA